MKKEANNLVTKSNKLVEANYKSRLTIREQKIILYLISKVQKDDSDFKTYTLSIKDFSEMMGLEGSPKYGEIEKITKNLLSKVIEIYEEDGLLQIHWLNKVKYNDGKGTVSFSFPSELKPYLLMLKREYTSYKLKNILELKSGYSIRVYEILKKWETIRHIKIELEKLKEMIGIDNKYSEYSNFKLRVLNRAQKELEKNTDISFTYDEIKEGRKVVALKFHIKSKSKVDILEETAVVDDLYDALFIQLIVDFEKKDQHLEKKVFDRWLKLADKVWGNNKYIELGRLSYQVLNKKTVDNPISYLTTLLKEKAKNAENRSVHKNIPEEEAEESYIPNTKQLELRLSGIGDTLKKKKILSAAKKK